MNKNNYLPFDLATALKHPERVVTRDGWKVSDLTKFDANTYQLAGLLGGDIKTWTISGVFNLSTENQHHLDLFLLPEVKECWMNVYESFGAVSTGCEYGTSEQAKMNISEESGTYIKTIRITNEPE